MQEATIHLAPSFEELVGHLHILISHLVPSPLDAMPVLTLGRGTERALMRALAQRSGGVCFSVRCIEPLDLATRLWILLNPDPQPFLSHEQLIWRLYKALISCKDIPVADSKDFRNLFALAERTAQLFETYALFRPAWLEHWSKSKAIAKLGEHEAWQHALWQQLIPALLRNQLIDKLCKEILPRTDSSKVHQVLGAEHIVLWDCIHWEAPFLHLAQSLRQHVSVHLFSFTPSHNFLDNLTSSWTFSDKGPHPLLASWCKKAVLFDSYLDHKWDNPKLYGHCSTFAPPVRTLSLLERLRNDLKYDCLTPFESGETPHYDIEFHRCHTPLRSLEVAWERIVATLSALKIPADEVLVLAADLERYHPFIAGIFAELPHAVAGSVADDPVLRTFKEVLHLARAGDFSWHRFFAFWNREDVRAGLGINVEQVAALKELLLQRALLRRDLQSSTHPNDWYKALARLLLGIIAGQSQVIPLADGALIQPVEGLTSEALELITPLVAFIEKVERLLELDKQQAAASAWLDALSDLGALLYETDQKLEKNWQAIVAKLREGLGESLETLPLTLDVLLFWAKYAAKPPREDAFLARGISFAPLSASTLVPAEVIVVLGMDDHTWPRSKERFEEDLLQADPQPDDPNPIQDEQLLLAKLIFYARKRLFFIWEGRSAQTNEPLPPASGVAELLTLLEHSYRLDPKRLLWDHPIYPFTPAHFSAEAPEAIRYHHPLQQRIAQTLAATASHKTPTAGTALLKIQLDKELTTQELARLISAPADWVLRKLGVARPLTTSRLPDPIPNSKPSGSVKQLLLETLWKRRYLEQTPRETIAQELTSSGLLALGALGEELFEELWSRVEHLNAAITNSFQQGAGSQAFAFRRLQAKVQIQHHTLILEEEALIVEKLRLRILSGFTLDYLLQELIAHLAVQQLGQINTLLVTSSSSKSNREAFALKSLPVAKARWLLGIAVQLGRALAQKPLFYRLRWWRWPIPEKPPYEPLLALLGIAGKKEFLPEYHPVLSALWPDVQHACAELEKVHSCLQRFCTYLRDRL